jgi:hypothetical protein
MGFVLFVAEISVSSTGQKYPGRKNIYPGRINIFPAGINIYPGKGFGGSEICPSFT